MEAATRRNLALLNATSKITANEVEDEAGIPNSYPTKRRHSHHNDNIL
jgi:hypothetical protein